MLFINCETQDKKDVVCCGPIDLHNDENDVKSGDLLEFRNVLTHEDWNKIPPKFSLKICEHSVVSIINPVNGSKKPIISFVKEIVPSPKNIKNIKPLPKLSEEKKSKLPI